MAGGISCPLATDRLGDIEPKLPIKPRAGLHPISRDRPGGHAEHLCSLGFSQSGEEPAFNHPAKAIVEYSQTLQGVVECKEFISAVSSPKHAHIGIVE
jgi:hypothetical protein